LTVCGWLLAKTTTLRVGTGVLVAGIHDHVHLAEQIALLQHASSGRFLLGIGTGYQAADFALFGRNPNRRKYDLESGLRGLGSIWSGSEARNGLHVVPTLDGVSRPTVWVGAATSAGLRIAAELADGIMLDPVRTDAELAAIATRYRDIATGEGMQPRVMAIRNVWVGLTDEVARDTYGPAVEPVARYFLRSGALGAAPELDEADLVLDGRLDERVICGSPATVVDRLVRLQRSTGAEALAFALRHPGGPDHASVLATLELLAAEVLPAVRTELGDPSTLQPPTSTFDPR
jgi:alkanesulfonate monooxygenase SsuD/methylene tetrahydromethanopterin reductase-like flavin-dependent oxidoreductase (luciferase family)